MEMMFFPKKFAAVAHSLPFLLADDVCLFFH